VFDFLFCGNNGILDDVHLSGKLKTPPPSFPRKWESRILMRQEFIGKTEV
ncbi:hypothetical protein NEILACOT_05617, partial [Neisseria lactamica ATCC 23970]